LSASCVALDHSIVAAASIAGSLHRARAVIDALHSIFPPHASIARTVAARIWAYTIALESSYGGTLGMTHVRLLVCVESLSARR